MRRPVLLLACLLVALASCGGDDDATGTTATTSQPTPETTAAPTTTTTSGATAAPTTTTTESPTTAPTTTAPTTTSTSAPPEDPRLVIEVAIAADGTVDVRSLPDVARGDEVTVIVTSEVADEVHVHGYDVYADLTPGVPTEFTFTADIPGIFEVELEGSHELLFELEVR